MDIGLSVQQAAGQVNVSPYAGPVKKCPPTPAGSCDETRLSVHRSKNHVRQSATSLIPELVKLLIVHLLDPSNRPSASLLVAAALLLAALKPHSSALCSRPAASLVSPI